MLPVALAILVSGCGGTSTPDAGTQPAATGPGTVAQVRVTPGPDAIATEREQGRLLEAYAPVAEHVSFLTSAVRLHELKLDRAGDLSLAAVRYRKRVAASRSSVAAVGELIESSEARDLLLASLDARLDALDELDGIELEETGRPIVARRRWDRFRSAWNSSIGSARGALNLFQEDRLKLGLSPAAERSVR